MATQKLEKVQQHDEVVEWKKMYEIEGRISKTRVYEGFNLSLRKDVPTLRWLEL